MTTPRDPLDRGQPLLPVHLLASYVYCPRLFHLQWVDGEWRDSADTLAGRRAHRSVDRPAGDLPPPECVPHADSGRATSLDLSSPEERLIARLDLLEYGNGSVVPIEYKHGAGPEEEDRAWDSDRIQVGAQALLLLANGYLCKEAAIWYAASRKRVDIPVDEDLLAEVRRCRDEALTTAAADAPPAPLRESSKCPRCSLVGICLPDENHLLAGRNGREDVRRLYPARDDARAVYVQAQGARIGKRGEELEIYTREEGKRRVRLIDVSHLVLFGNVSLSAPLIHELCRRGIPISHFTYGGWFHGITHGLGPRNGWLRLHQYRAVEDLDRRLALARGFVERKILNSRTMLRRNGRGLDPEVLVRLAGLGRQAARAASYRELLGIEGMAARTYFQSFPKLLHPPAGREFDFAFQHRNRRPPRDPVNALLSFSYAVLVRDWTHTLLAVGLDPYLGFLHQPRFGRPALSLDLMEEFRPVIADSVVLQLVNNGEIQAKDLIRRHDAVALLPEGRKKFFLAYERRMNHLVRHPLFGYRVSYRQLLELQARLFGRFLTGELDRYDGFRTR